MPYSFKLLYFLVFLVTTSLSAEDENFLNKGDLFPQINFTNQFEKEALLSLNIKKIIFVSDMDASKIAHSVLEKDGDAILNQSEAVFISDIHKMPALITRFVALPKMRSYTYTMHLIRDENVGSNIPRKKGSLTLISLEQGKIKSIEFADEVSKLNEFLSSNPSKKK
ncbi:hypothetical protein [Leptospira sp. 'Mane']|uniref:hypothetical protein n=1 Tax=Leptospira sp. 'Mane' TaxID=3387407 RepID=UPI00398A7768